MFVTATAIAGGVLLATGREDERFPREILARTPFDNFTVPGWLLGAGVGRTRASVIAGAIMMAWIIAEAALAVQPRPTAIEGLFSGGGPRTPDRASWIHEVSGWPLTLELMVRLVSG